MQYLKIYLFDYIRHFAVWFGPKNQGFNFDETAIISNTMKHFKNISRIHLIIRMR